MHDQDLTLDQMLNDPIVRLLMARDGVAEAGLRDLAARCRSRRRAMRKDAAQVSPEPRSLRPEVQA